MREKIARIFAENFETSHSPICRSSRTFGCSPLYSKYVR